MKKRLLSGALVIALLLSMSVFTALAKQIEITDAGSYKTQNLSGNNLFFKAESNGGEDVIFRISENALTAFYNDSEIRFYTFSCGALTVRADKNCFYDFGLSAVEFKISPRAFYVTYRYKNGSFKNLETTSLNLRYTVTGASFVTNTNVKMNGETLTPDSCDNKKLVFSTNKTGVFTPSVFEFSDVKNKSLWYYGYVNTAGAFGIVTGMGNGSFAPQNQIRRCELATLIVQATKHIINYKENENVSFSDVKKGVWYYEFVNKCAAAGLMSGRGNGIFDPEANASRQEIAVVAANFVKLLDTYDGKELPTTDIKTVKAELSKLYPDSKNIADWSQESVLLCNKLGIMKGDLQGFFPTRNLTRAEGAKIFHDIYFKAVKG